MSTDSGRFSERDRAPSKAAAIAYRAAQRAMTLDVTRLLSLESHNVRGVEVDPRFAFRFLTTDEVYTHSLDPANDLPSSFVDRLLGGRDFCYAALDGDTLASYAWYALESIEAEQNRGRQRGSGVSVSFGSDTAFAYKAFTRPEFRGRHLYTACKARVVGALSSHGVSRVLVTTDWTNRAVLAGCRRAGFRELGIIWRFGWPGAMFTIGPRGIASQGILLGRHARAHRMLSTRGLSATPSELAEPVLLDS